MNLYFVFGIESKDRVKNVDLNEAAVSNPMRSRVFFADESN